MLSISRSSSNEVSRPISRSSRYSSPMICATRVRTTSSTCASATLRACVVTGVSLAYGGLGGALSRVKHGGCQGPANRKRHGIVTYSSSHPMHHAVHGDGQIVGFHRSHH